MPVGAEEGLCVAYPKAESSFGEVVGPLSSQEIRAWKASLTQTEEGTPKPMLSALSHFKFKEFQTYLTSCRLKRPRGL